MRILLKRSGALGDVILSTPVLRRLRVQNPDAHIDVATGYPDVFRGNPHASAVNRPSYEHDLTIDLDLAYERRPTMHIVDAYMTEAFGDGGFPAEKRQELFFKPRRLFDLGRPVVAVHAAQAGWRNRTLPRETWVDVVDRLQRLGMWPILVGSPKDALAGVPVTSFHSTDIHAQAQVIAAASCFVGSDSAMLHVAGATDTPIVGVFTCAAPEHRMPWRHGSLAWKTYAVLPGLDCVGCLGRVPPPTTVESCERGDIACVREVTAKQIVEGVQKMI